MLVVVTVNKLKPLAHASDSLREYRYRAQLQGAFSLAAHNRSRVGDPYGRREGNPVLWESSETPGELAKAADLSERLPGMCGSVGHGEGLALNREG